MFNHKIKIEIKATTTNHKIKIEVKTTATSSTKEWVQIFSDVRG